MLLNEISCKHMTCSLLMEEVCANLFIALAILGTIKLTAHIIDALVCVAKNICYC